MNFADRLRQARDEAGLSVAGLADRLSVAPRTVERWESGATEPSLSDAVRLALVLDVALDWLAAVAVPST